MDEDMRNGTWTNEKHVNFINSMEASFVRTMLENNGRLLRLDRHLPDTSDSTLDLKYNKPLINANSSSTGTEVIYQKANRTNGRSDKRSRRLQPHRHDSSQDQVVPQVENIDGDKDGRATSVTQDAN